MGFFDKIKSGFDKAVKWVGEKIAQAFDWATGENTRKAIKKVNDETKQIREELNKERDKNAKEVADSLGDDSYDVETANAREIRFLSDELYKVQESFKDKAFKTEESIIECIHGTVHDMLEQFEKVNGTAKLNLNMAYLNSMENSLRNHVEGFIQKRIRRSLSLDNSECKEILKMQGKSAKEDALKRFQDKIFSEAVDELWELVKDVFTEKNSAIFAQIENRFSTIEMQTEESIRHFEEIKKTKMQDKDKLNEKKQAYQNMIDIAEWCIESIEGDNLA